MTTYKPLCDYLVEPITDTGAKGKYSDLTFTEQPAEVKPRPPQQLQDHEAQMPMMPTGTLVTVIAKVKQAPAEKYRHSGNEMPETIKEGDTIVYTRYTNNSQDVVKMEGKEYKQIDRHQIIGIIT